MRKTLSISIKVASAPGIVSATMTAAHGEAEMISDVAPAAPAGIGMTVAPVVETAALIGDDPAVVMSK